jgi:DNA polymerase lambda
MSLFTEKPKIKARVKKPPVAPTALVEMSVEELLSFPLFDLRKTGGLTNTIDSNDGIVQILDQLINYTIQLKASSAGKEKATHQRRITSFIRGRDAIKDYGQEITSGSQAQKEIDGVGKGISTRIHEYITTGKLKELEKSVTDEAILIMELCEITGIGEVKAKSLIDDFNVSSVDDLITKYQDGTIKVAKNQLTHHITIGLDFYHDLKKRMPWSEADQIAKHIVSSIGEIDSKLIVKVCGSYRRKKPTCGDLDILVANPSTTKSVSLPDIVTAVEKSGLLVGHLTSNGQTKYMGVCRGPSGIGRRIDIRLVDHNSLGAAILYFTGSGKFNKIMRYHANTRGYTLNEYGLYTYVNGVKGETPIPAVSEEDIFSTLGFVYLAPTQREF